MIVDKSSLYTKLEVLLNEYGARMAIDSAFSRRHSPFLIKGS
jgi:hypothetical protein